MSTKTISWVSDVSDPVGQYGTLYVNVAFTDDTVGSIGAKDADKAKMHHDAFLALKDTEAEFTLEDAGTSSKGKPKFKIKGYPGYEPKPYDGSGGGGGKYLAFDERLELDRYQHERMDRRTALMQAIAYSDADADTILDLAGQFYKWLRKTSEPHTARGSDNAGTGAKEPPPTSVPAPQSPDEVGTASGESSGLTKGEGEAPAVSPANCSHPSWKAAPRAGWELCERCGNARKAAA